MKGFYRPRRNVIYFDNEGGEHAHSDKSNSIECLGGCRLSRLPRIHGSAEEATYCNKLKAQSEAGEFPSYASQVNYQLRDREGKRAGVHYVDFEIRLSDGRIKVQEYKGQRTTEWLLKRALFSWTYPEIEYETVGRRNLI